MSRAVSAAGVRAMVLGLALMLAGVAQAAASAPVAREYFGFHAHRLATLTPWPSVPFGSWRLWDAYVGWPYLEAEAQRWTFQVLDKYLAMASEHGVEILLPLGLSPSWASARPDEDSAYKKPGWAAEPADMANWERYVRTVVRRYKGRIRNYEIWNEPNLSRFFSGSVPSMVKLSCAAAKIIHEEDSDARLVSPSATGIDKGLEWLEAFMQAGGAACVEVVGFHFYTLAHEGPEAMLGPMRQVREIAGRYGNKPVWNTETGWYFANARVPTKTRYRVRQPDEAAAFVMRAYILGASMGLERFYWYAWDNATMGGLIEPDSGEPKPAVQAIATVMRWLVGASIGPCAADAGGVWLCALDDEKRGRAWLVWHPGAAVQWPLPSAVSARVRSSVSGSLPIGQDRRIEVGIAPLLLTERTQPW